MNTTSNKNTVTNNCIKKSKPFSFPKSERICKKKVIENLFSKERSESFAIFPIRVVYYITTASKKAEETCMQTLNDKELTEPVSVLFSVGKRHFKRAVKRNRIKRQLRETYRLQKTSLRATAQSLDIHVDVAFLWLTNEVWETSQIAIKMNAILERLEKKISTSKEV
ncbi:MAG: ribonuclease P protein component [Bacteroidaceae bacterium]